MQRGVRRSWDARTQIRNLDSFSKEVPGFNIRGESHFKTIAGGLMTVLILIVVLSYSM